MSKPKTLKEAIVIIESLKKRLDKYDNKKTMAKFYLGLKSQLDYYSSLMINLLDDSHLDESDEDEKRKKEFKMEKQFDRMTKFQERSKQHVESLVFIKEHIDPAVIESLEQESGSIYEEIMKELKNAGS